MLERRTRHRVDEARRRLGRRAQPEGRVRTRPASDRARVQGAPPPRRAAGRGPAKGRIRARPRSPVDDPLLPRPRNRPARRARRAHASGRRLQSQEQPDLPGRRRPRPAGSALPRRPVARRPPGERVHVRADRQAGQAAQGDGGRTRDHTPLGWAAARRCWPGSPWPPAKSRLAMSAWGPTSRGASPTPRAGSAAAAIATRGGAAPAAAGSRPERVHSQKLEDQP